MAALELGQFHSRRFTAAFTRTGIVGGAAPLRLRPRQAPSLSAPKCRRPTDQTEVRPTSAMDASKSNNDCPKATMNTLGEAELQKNNMATGQARQQGKRSGQQSSMQRIEASQGILVG